MHDYGKLKDFSQIVEQKEGIKLHHKKSFLDKEFEKNQRVIFSKRLNEALEERDQKETLDSLAELFDVERTTVNNWKHGKCLPGKAKRRNIARKLNKPENYFEPDYTLEDQDLADARYLHPNTYPKSLSRPILPPMC